MTLKRRGQVWQTLAPWLIALAFLLIILIAYGIISGKLTGAADYFKTLLRFGR